MKTKSFDIAEYLDDPEVISQYLNTVLEEGDGEDLVDALGHVSRAVGMSKIAERTGMSRTSLYKALSKDSKPQFDTILRVLKAIGGTLQVKPLPSS